MDSGMLSFNIATVVCSNRWIHWLPFQDVVSGSSASPSTLIVLSQSSILCLKYQYHQLEVLLSISQSYKLYWLSLPPLHSSLPPSLPPSLHPFIPLPPSLLSLNSSSVLIVSSSYPPEYPAKGVALLTSWAPQFSFPAPRSHTSTKWPVMVWDCSKWGELVPTMPDTSSKQPWSSPVTRQLLFSAFTCQWWNGYSSFFHQQQPARDHRWCQPPSTNPLPCWFCSSSSQDTHCCCWTHLRLPPKLTLIPRPLSPSGQPLHKLAHFLLHSLLSSLIQSHDHFPYDCSKRYQYLITGYRRFHSGRLAPHCSGRLWSRRISRACVTIHSWHCVTVWWTEQKQSNKCVKCSNPNTVSTAGGYPLRTGKRWMACTRGGLRSQSKVAPQHHHAHHLISSWWHQWTDAFTTPWWDTSRWLIHARPSRWNRTQHRSASVCHLCTKHPTAPGHCRVSPRLHPAVLRHVVGCIIIIGFTSTKIWA